MSPGTSKEQVWMDAWALNLLIYKNQFFFSGAYNPGICLLPRELEEIRNSLGLKPDMANICLMGIGLLPIP